ncbi:phytochrome A-associated F-box protein-like [Abrus precatorius]|uniref:Phytochrome A-associated F-box protein-like n=1 Tax=Abrus precatorius TaxID=3816 RepID=A0A8B8L5E7_ABRPR|nr:phytochrome A-associated F-box protein-like [Abrus precatorius]XP_027349910.1 phytochrome A-associated F-box protein-like [Abrus precatorius]
MEGRKMGEKEKNAFTELTDDIILNIFFNLEDDPRHWGRLACVCTKFSSLIRDFCWKRRSSRTIPSDLLSTDDPSIHKLSFCCPGLLHAGLLLDTSDFGLERDLGPDQSLTPSPSPSIHLPPPPPPHDSSSCWSLFDDLYYDTLYDATESHEPPPFPEAVSAGAAVSAGVAVSACKKRKVSRSWRSHLASGTWSLSREQGSKLLARQFRDDCLYVCDWPGCVHKEEKRKYRLFRGVFKNFKRTRVWRTIHDANRKKLDLPCAFCSSMFTWDLHSAFCLRRGFGFHDDGEPVVRAFVCENGHVSGAWTDVPMYS